MATSRVHNEEHAVQLLQQVNAYHKEHLTLVVMRKKKQSVDCVQRDLVIISLAMGPDEFWIYLHGVATPETAIQETK